MALTYLIAAIVLGGCLAGPTNDKRFIFFDSSSGMQSPFHRQPGQFGSFGGSVSTAIPIVDQAHVTYTNPCVPSQSVCHFNCPSGYVQGPSGCHYCACTHDHTETTTRANGVALSIATTKVPTVQMTTVNTTCEDAKTLCDLKCAGSGYFVDHDDCTSCICKSDIGTHSGK